MGLRARACFSRRRAFPSCRDSASLLITPIANDPRHIAFPFAFFSCQTEHRHRTRLGVGLSRFGRSKLQPHLVFRKHCHKENGRRYSCPRILVSS
jgi:hypothetical protein